MRRLRRAAQHRVARSTTLRGYWPSIDQETDRAETDRYLARAGRAEGTSKAWALRNPSQISVTPSPGAEIRDDDACPRDRTGRVRRLRKSTRAASLAAGRGPS